MDPGGPRLWHRDHGARVADAPRREDRPARPPALPGRAVADRRRRSRQLRVLETPARARTREDLLGGLVIAPFVLIMLLGAMLPTIDFDVLEYHLQGPKEYYQAG